MDDQSPENEFSSGVPGAVAALSALANDSRLGVFRLLVTAGPDGLPAGAIAREFKTPPSTLSAQLTILSHAGLIRARRDGRSIRYSAEVGRMRDLLRFLLADCCGGRPEICQGLEELAGAAR